MPTDGADVRIHAFMVTYHRVDATVRAITALQAQSRPPDTILVVNNGDPADGVAIGTAHPAASVIDAGDNLGPAGGWELGVRTVLAMAADEDWLLIADEEVPPPADDTVEHLFAFATAQVRADPNVAGVGAVGGRFDRSNGAAIRIPDEQIDDAVDVDTIGGGHWPLLRVAAIRSVELPDPSLFFGFEELDYFLKVREAGFRLVVDGALWRELRLRHQRVGVTRAALRGTAQPPWRAYYSTRNQILLARRFGSSTARWRAAVIGGARAARSLGTRQPSTAWAHLRGVLDGVFGRLGRRWEPPT